MENCLFCRIINKEIPVQPVFENESVIVIRDINPQAPTHLLAIPKKHYAGIHDVPADDKEVFSSLFGAVGEVAKKFGLDLAGYRQVINSGESTGQTVHHIHVHILSGRDFTWPPG